MTGALKRIILIFATKRGFRSIFISTERRKHDTLKVYCLRCLKGDGNTDLFHVSVLSGSVFY
jgi:hypothetical protein